MWLQNFGSTIGYKDVNALRAVLVLRSAFASAMQLGNLQARIGVSVASCRCTSPSADALSAPRVKGKLKFGRAERQVAVEAVADLLRQEPTP
jgi:hypothetical protein